MSRSLAAILIALLVIGIAGAHQASDVPVMKIRGWGKVIDPDRDCRVAVEGARVTIESPGTSHDFAAELEQWNAPRIMQRVHGDFVAEVKVCGSFEPASGGSTIEGRKPYNGGGILLTSDRMNHISIQRAAFREGDRIRHYLNFELRQSGKSTVARYSMDMPDGDCWVRMERHGKRFNAAVSQDSVNWRSYPPIEAKLPQDAHIGVEVVNSTKETFKCGFEDLELFQAMTDAKRVDDKTSKPIVNEKPATDDDTRASQ